MPEPHTVTLAPQGEAGLASILFFLNFCLESYTGRVEDCHPRSSFQGLAASLKPQLQCHLSGVTSLPTPSPECTSLFTIIDLFTFSVEPNAWETLIQSFVSCLSPTSPGGAPCMSLAAVFTPVMELLCRAQKPLPHPAAGECWKLR